MFWFIAGVSINGIAILGVLGNALYDAFTLRHGSSHNNVVNLIGFVLFIIVLIAFNLRSSGNAFSANVLLWIPAVPLSLMLIFFLVYVIVVFTTKPDWK